MYFSRWLFLLTAMLGLVTSGQAQRSLYSQQQRTIIDRLRSDLAKDRADNLQRAIRLARQRNIPTEQVRADGTVVIVSGVDERNNLLFDATYSATRAGQTTRTSSLYAGGSLGLSLNGSSPAVANKIGIWDAGRVLNTHVELTGRVTQVDNPSRTDNHATHVAGILVGAGVNPLTRGMAFGGRLRAWDFSSDDPEMIAAAPDLLVSNHSYGTVAGWVYNGDRSGDVKWEWHGDTTVSATEDFKFGLYNFEARDWDRIAYNAPYYLIVKSAGNNHAANGPGADQPYVLINRNSISRTPRRDQNGYDQIATYGTSKNVLVVGAVNTISPEYTQPSDVRIASFSSWGPTDDGRIKPDLVGVGVSVLSAGAANNDNYQALNGTSMSTPNVTGSLLLLQEYYNLLHTGRFLRSSTLRGLAIHSADEAGSAPGPDYRHGWGLLNTEQAARVIANADRSHVLEERTLAQNQSQTVQLVASGRGPLVVTICWTDPEGTPSPTGPNGLNDRTPKLVNDLDIRLSNGTTVTQPWTLDPASPDQAARPGDNVLDNVEQIRIENPVPGTTYTLTISHKGSLRNTQQEFALLASGVGGTAYCASNATGPGGTQIDRVRFAGIDQAGAAGCQPYSSFLNVTGTVASGQRLPLEITTGSCGTARPAIVKAFIDWNLDGDFADAGELVATSGELLPGATFTTEITAPPGLTNGQTTRLRILAVETTSAAQVQACGTFATGETQEYLVRYSRPQNDVGVTALLSPQESFCPQSALEISVRIRNFGTVTQNNIPVTVRILKPDNTPVATLTGNLQRPLGPLQETEFVLTGQIPLQYGQPYRFVVTTNLSSDQDASNNPFTDQRTVAQDPASDARFTASFCSETPVTLQNLGAGTAFWYDSPQGGNLLGVGNLIRTPIRTTNNVYYASLNEFNATLGPVSKQDFTGGSYAGNFGPQPLITTQVPLILESARLYIGSAGQITFTVRKLDETVVSTVTLNVTPTRNPNTPAGQPPAGQLSDDPTDPGEIYNLNLRIPEPGNYKITIAYDGGASIFRSNSGVSGFPFEIPGVARLRGSLFNNDTIRNAYYYLYNLRLRSLGCSAGQRTQVTAQSATSTLATVTATGPTSICRGESVTLRAPESQAVTYQWVLNGNVIPGATTATLAATESGAYAVRVTGTCAPVLSEPLAVTVREPARPTLTRNGFTLTSSVATGNQWFRDSVAISGATGSSFQVTRSGRYAVRASPNGCVPLLSEAVSVEVITGLEPHSGGSLHLFPVPATRELTIEFEPVAATGEKYTAVLTDARGVPLQTLTLLKSGRVFSRVLDVSTLPGGPVFVAILNETGVILRQGRFLKL
ncbi:S8 family serine peptidase [Tellurirhabdus rosea]|uniref:S8 family serine peptidase n=1 Tax=Tellurirhabdus rosea TaxID=2674997 RepID=UPI00224EE365|nr:S8 family serine peptidase [Tellurirhabdus rosea]